MLFKSGLIYKISNDKFDIADITLKKTGIEPKPMEWQTCTIIKPDVNYEDEPCVPYSFNIHLNGGRVHFEYFNASIISRVLPSSTINRYVKLKAREWMIDCGTKPSRDVVAQWKGDFVEQFLPEAPTKEDFIPILIIDNSYIFIGTSNKKYADAVITEILAQTSINSDIGVILCNLPSLGLMESILSFGDASHGDDKYFLDGFLKIRGHDNEKKANVTNDDNMDLVDVLKGQGIPVEIGILANDLSFTLTDKCAIKRLSFKGLVKYKASKNQSDGIENARGNLVLQAQAIYKIIQLVLYWAVSPESEL